MSFNKQFALDAPSGTCPCSSHVPPEVASGLNATNQIDEKGESVNAHAHHNISTGNSSPGGSSANGHAHYHVLTRNKTQRVGKNINAHAHYNVSAGNKRRGGKNLNAHAHYNVSTGNNSRGGNADGAMDIHSLYMDPEKIPRRIDRVKRLCKKYKLKDKPWEHKSQLSHFIVDDKHRTLYCSIAKVGCTSWKYFFINLTTGGAVEKLDDITDVAHPWVHKFIRKNMTTLDSFAKDEIQYRLNTYFKFMVVRNPFDRLYASYRDKFLLMETGNKENVDTKFYDYWSARIRNVTHRDGPISFSDFVQYLIATDHWDYNAHWATYHSLCHPCSIKYNYIAKYRTLNTDIKYILMHMNVTDTGVPHLHTHATEEEEAFGSHFRSLDTEVVRKLFKIYIKDFRLFGYPSSAFVQND